MQVQDSIRFTYETAKWDKPAVIQLKQTALSNGVATIEAVLKDASGIQCLDAAQLISFDLTGDGQLIDNQGTSSGSRKVQLYNGRAVIRVKLQKGRSVLSAQINGVPTAFINLQ